jgi:mono/diheme cytochrome c family protein
MPRYSSFSLALLGMALLYPPLSAASPDHSIVPGFERFADTKTDPDAGRLLLGELNCVSCHQTTETAILRKQAPILDGVGNRVRATAIAKFLADPQTFKPGTTMPNLLADDPEKAKKIEALVHFLVSTGTLRESPINAKDVTTGQNLYNEIGCVACHGSRDAKGLPDKTAATSVPLGDLKAKYALPGLSAFLENPLTVRPSGRMPHLLNAKEAREVASYLLQGLKSPREGKGAVNVSYFEGKWEHLPDFNKLKVKAKDKLADISVSFARRHSDYALRFEGYLNIEQEGKYTFVLTSDDGSVLWIDGKKVVDNDGVHPVKTTEGSVKLTKGVHQVTIGYFQGGGEDVLEAQYEGPGLNRRALSSDLGASEAELTRKSEPKKDEPDHFAIQPVLVEKGRELFGSLGCASCHTLKVDGKPIASTKKAKALTELKGNIGCLASKPGADVPHYALSSKQREALTASLTARSPAPTPAMVIIRTLTTFNCYACHTRDKVGGPPDALNGFFKTTQPEMGEEARMPPWLDGVGAKLTTEYFRGILDRGAHDRPYMQTRMPGFGVANVGSVMETFASLDKLPPVPEPKTTVPVAKLKTTGRHLVGAQGFSCFKCHTFAGQKAEGVQGIDMLKMPQRLRPEWFYAWVEDPQKVRPGTRMPSGFLAGKSVLPDVLDGTPASQILAMWTYLKDGDKAQLPIGMLKNSIPLIPDGGAILYRNFIQGAGSRAIGVGYPERVNLAFDANDIRLAMIWQGGFIDARRHWTDRGSGYEAPLGDNIVHLPAGAPFALLDKPDTAWPKARSKELGFKFQGYRLTSDDRPTFLYALGAVSFEDFPNAAPESGSLGLKRSFTLTATAPTENLYYRAALGKIEPLKDGWYQVDGALKVRITGAGASVVRKTTEGKQELIVPVPLKDGKASFTQEYLW